MHGLKVRTEEGGQAVLCELPVLVDPLKVPVLIEVDNEIWTLTAFRIQAPSIPTKDVLDRCKEST